VCNRVLSPLGLSAALALTLAVTPYAGAQDSKPPQKSEQVEPSDGSESEQRAPSGEPSDTVGAEQSPVFSPGDEFKPSEDVSEDLSIPFPVDI